MDAIKTKLEAKLEELQQRRAAIYGWLCTTAQYQELLQLDAVIGVLSELAEGAREEAIEAIEAIDADRSGV